MVITKIALSKFKKTKRKLGLETYPLDKSRSSDPLDSLDLVRYQVAWKNTRDKTCRFA